MDADRWRRVEDLFHRCLEVDPSERQYLLDASCDDDAVKAAVERLLEADRSGDEWDSDFAILSDSPGVTTDPWLGRVLGVFRIEERIAAGGMGIVYRARRDDGLFDQQVAVKVLRAEVTTADALRRFAFERAALAAMHHANIARLLDGGTTERGSPYLVMELIDGWSIDRYAAEQHLSIEERLRLFIPVCRAVQFAHQSLVVHRDLKPSNVLIDRDGTPKLVDFGIARLLDADGAEASPTLTAGRVLTPEYASPEQLQGESLTTATDIYSLGVLLFELLVGRPPFSVEGRSPTAWSLVIQEQLAPRPSQVAHSRTRPVAAEERDRMARFAQNCGSSPSRLARELRGDLDRIILMALRKEPSRRYASAGVMADDIERYLRGMPVVARADTLGYRVGKFVRRNRLAVALAAVVVIALIGGIASTSRMARVARQERDAARRAQERASVDAEHAAIEALSFRQVADFLVDAFLGVGVLGHDDQVAAADRSIQRQAERIRSIYADNPHLRANLLDALARVSGKLRLYDAAEQLIGEARDIRRATFGEQSLEVALSLGSLGTLRYEQARYPEAAATLEEALRLHQGLPVDVHTDVATAANDLGCALRKSGDLDGAAEVHRLALSLRRESAGADSLAVAMSLNNLAGVHLDRGDLEAASECFRESLDIRSDVLGSHDPMTLQSMMNLAIPIYNLGDPEEAQRLVRRAADGYRALGDEGLEGLARSLSNLGGMLIQGDHADQAIPILQEAATTLGALLGEEHPHVAVAEGKHAIALLATGQVEEARVAAERAVEKLRSASEGATPYLADGLWMLGMCQEGTGDLDAARATLLEAIELATLESSRKKYQATLAKLMARLDGEEQPARRD